MKKLIITLLIVVLLAMTVGTALAHNVGHVDTGNGGCVDVGAGADSAPPEGNAWGTEGHARGVHHAGHAGQSAVEGGSC